MELALVQGVWYKKVAHRLRPFDMYMNKMGLDRVNIGHVTRRCVYQTLGPYSMD